MMILSLLFLFIILQILDSLSTVYIIKNGGKEANPVMNWLMDKVGIPGALSGVKIVLLILVVAAWNETLLFWIDALYICVVGWNFYQIVKEPK